MNIERKLPVVLLLITVLALSLIGCGGKDEPPSDKVIIELLNEYNGEEGQYLWGSRIECLVPADAGDVVEEWDISYTRDDLDGSSEEWVKIVKNSAGEWSVSNREGCMVR